jgi:2-polyprenyl-6-methoxyphenol hydroxylase-like FAD-dependent oxidoreductase
MRRSKTLRVRAREQVSDASKDILIVGAGIGGLTLALSLHAVGLGDRVHVFDTVSELKPVGGGLNLGPHAVKVLTELGLEDALLKVSKQPYDYAFFTRHGQLVYREPWGKAAGHKWHHISIHRAELHRVLTHALEERIGADTHPILTYPMVDRDPLDRWTFERITLLGDAAHPMFPRGGNGAAQSILDALFLSQRMAEHAGDLAPALPPYESERRPATSRVVLQNRVAPPNIIVDTVEKMSGGKAFARIEDVIASDELRKLFENYQKVAGYHVDMVGKR